MNVGILGGGQLGLMLAEALTRLNTRVHILESAAEAPCVGRVAGVMRGSVSDAAVTAEFFSRCDLVTYEFENLEVGALRAHAEKLRPSLKVLEVSQNRINEKRFLAQLDVWPVVFQVVPEGEHLEAAVRSFGWPCIVKSALGGYDGKSQFRVTDEAGLARLPAGLAGGSVIEETLELRMELSCIVAREAGGQTHAFPLFENVHEHHVLESTVVPARVSETIRAEAVTRAIAIAQALQVVGLLTVEFFVGTGRDGVERLYVNELAPRVHNSGHVTRKACSLSQFDALARILSGVPLIQPTLFSGGWCMGQLLGDVWLAQGRAGGDLDLTVWREFPSVVEVYLYGKSEARAGRKMGHFLVHEATVEAAVATARRFRAALMASGARGVAR